QAFDTLAVIDFGVTLPAIGRSVYGDWIQVVYTGPDGDPVRGWIVYWLLRWTGNLLDLPVDGIDPLPFTRRTGPLITIYPETYYYRGSVSAANQVTDTVDEPTQAELTGRIGSAGNGQFWVQFRMDGEIYWTGSWAVEMPASYARVIDASYLYSYGRLAVQFRAELDETRAVAQVIRFRWADLAQRGEASCNTIPAPVAINATYLAADDLASAPIYDPLLVLMDAAFVDVNAARQQLVDLCASADRVTTAAQIDGALALVDRAERSLTLIETLLPPINTRDPLLGGN
ncbi:MAG: hypothetical protein ACOCXZ_03385, partial [Chloroflexota bacterium]